MKFYTAHYIAEHLRVSPAVVYDWMHRSMFEGWTHDAPPEPLSEVFTTKRSSRSRSVWSEEQLDEWKTWHAKYLSEKWTGGRPRKTR